MVWSFYSTCTAAITPLLHVCSLEVRVLHCLDKDTLSVSCVRELLFPASLSSSHLNQIGWDERCGALALTKKLILKAELHRSKKLSPQSMPSVHYIFKHAEHH